MFLKSGFSHSSARKKIFFFSLLQVELTAPMRVMSDGVSQISLNASLFPHAFPCKLYSESVFCPL